MTDPTLGPDDELARLLRRLRSAQPDQLSSVDDVMGDVRHRVVRRQQVHRAAAGVVAVVAAVALVVVPSQLGGGSDEPGDILAPPTGSISPGHPLSPSPSPTKSTTKSPGTNDQGGGNPSGRPNGGTKRPSDDPTVVLPTSGYDDHGCPLVWAGPADTAWLPKIAPELASDVLLPAGPEFLAVCDYPLSSTGSRSLSRSVSVRAGFTEMVSAVGSDPAAQLDWCTDEDADDVYLLRANYADGSVVWISASVGQGCGGATNGQFSSTGSFGGQLASVLSNKGTWGGAYPGDCAVSDARAGRAEQMAPTKDLVRMFICVSNPAAGQRAQVRTENLTDINELAGRVNVLPAASGSPSCADPGGKQTYLINFRYDGGEDVTVRVVPDCETGVSNGVQVAATSDSLIELLERRTRD